MNYFVSLVSVHLYVSVLLSMVTIGPMPLACAFSAQKPQYCASLSSFRGIDRTRPIISCIKANRVRIQQTNVISLQASSESREVFHGLRRRYCTGNPYTSLSNWIQRNIQKLRYVLLHSRKIIRQYRYYIWFLAMFLSWNVAIPKTIATSPTTAAMISIRPHGDATTINEQLTDVSKQSHDGNSFHAKVRSSNHDNHHQRSRGQVRFITTFGVIFATSAIGISKVNRRNLPSSDHSIQLDQDSDNTMERDSDLDVTTSSSSYSSDGSDLAWLLPKMESTNDDPTPNTTTATQSMVSNVGASNALTMQTTKKSDDVTKVVERLKQIAPPSEVVKNTNSGKSYSAENLAWLAKSIGTSASKQQPVVSRPSKKNVNINNDSPYNSEKLSWLAKSIGKTIPKQQLQQPRSMKEETMLQAKYASIESLEERAFTILMDLGMVEPTPNPFESAWE